jgi:hypothetical protein
MNQMSLWMGSANKNKSMSKYKNHCVKLKAMLEMNITLTPARDFLLETPWRIYIY